MRVCVALLTLWIAGGAMAAAGESWRVVEQPELKEALERAPALPTEPLGEPARGVNVWERWLVPNPDGQTWDVLQVYFKEYYGPTWLYAIDLGTGRVTKQRLADGHQFYLSGRALGFDGKFYIATPSRKTWSMDLFVYDPATDTLEERGEIVHGLGGEVRPLVVGPDGRIYGTGTRGNQVGLYIFDPKLGKVVKDFGPVGPSHPNGAWSRYVMGVDDTHAYIASGMIPAWYLVAVNLATGEQKVLLESPTERVMDIIESFPGAYARVPQGTGLSDKEYWLYHGQAIPMANGTPPWPKQASPWDKAVPKPEVYFDQIDPDAQGNAVLWYRSREDAAKVPKDPPRDAEPQALGWKSVRLEGVPSYPHRINPMSILPDGRLYGTGDDYAGVFVFDPRTDQTTILGPRPGLAPYTQIVCGGKLYSSGYSGGHLFVYDPAQPWTLSIGGPPGHPAPSQADARSNPRYLGDFDKTTRVGLMHSSALGADGRIYFGGFGLRHYTGGGLGWFDPKTEKMDGFWEPLGGYAVQWIAPALEGRLIIISTVRAADERNDNRTPEEAKLFVYDVSEQKIVRQIVPVAKGRTTGLVTEVAPGCLLGLTSNAEHSDRSMLYGVDVATGEVLFTKALPSLVSVDNYWPHWVDPSYEYNAFVRGPDGFVWTYLKNVLVRVDPKDANVHVVGKVDPVGWPTFVGNDIYFSGPEQLRRIRNVVPEVARPRTTRPLRIHPANPRYFTNGSKNADGTLKAVYLTGSHTWNSLVDMDKADPPAPFDYGAYLDFLQRYGHNFIRLWTWDSVAWDTRANRNLGKDFVHHCAPLAWARTGPGNALDGKPKFDLTKFNPEYFDRLRTRVRAAGDRGIYVSVMLFEAWGLRHGDRNRAPAPNGWAYRSHPFHPDNNVNGITGDLNGDGIVLEVHSSASPAITALQEAYVRKVVDTVNDLDNVLYEVANEGGDKDWNWWVVKTVKDYERTKPQQHPVGITGHGGERIATMLASPADWISPGGQDGYRDPAPVWEGRKVSLLDTDHIWGVGGNHAWVWRSFLRGHNPIFMDPYDGAALGDRFDPKFEPFRRNMGYTLRYARKIDLAAMTPHGELSSTEFCLADPGKEYLVYLPNGGEVTVDLSAASGSIAIEWLDPRSGDTTQGQNTSGGQKRSFKPPFDGDAVLYLRRQS